MQYYVWNTRPSWRNSWRYAHSCAGAVLNSNLSSSFFKTIQYFIWRTRIWFAVNNAYWYIRLWLKFNITWYPWLAFFFTSLGIDSKYDAISSYYLGLGWKLINGFVSHNWLTQSPSRAKILCKSQHRGYWNNTMISIFPLAQEYGLQQTMHAGTTKLKHSMVSFGGIFLHFIMYWPKPSQAIDHR